MDADIFVSGKKKLRIQKYPATCGRGPREAEKRDPGNEVSLLMTQMFSMKI